MCVLMTDCLSSQPYLRLDDLIIEQRLRLVDALALENVGARISVRIAQKQQRLPVGTHLLDLLLRALQMVGWQSTMIGAWLRTLGFTR